MKVYPNLLEALVKAWTDVFQNGHHAGPYIARFLKSNPKWGSRDRRFIATHYYDLIRNYRLLHEILGHEPQNHNDWKKMIGIQWLIQGETLPEFEVFKTLNETEIIQKYNELKNDFAIKHSIPEWLQQLGKNTLPKQWENIMAASNQKAALVLRVNTLKADAKKVIAHLKEAGLEVQKLTTTTLTLPHNSKVKHLKAYQKGWFEIQDLGSQQIAPFLEIKPGATVIDACAGAGGKSLHLAAIMKNKGRIIAMDIYPEKLKELERRAKRNGVRIIETHLIKNTQLSLEQFKEKADFLLMDVPCSGLGVLRRKPDTKWKLSPKSLDKTRSIQQNILNNYVQFLKPGGKLVYATCSILPSENEEQTQFFLKNNANQYKSIQSQSILPDEYQDGYFMHLIEKK